MGETQAEYQAQTGNKVKTGMETVLGHGAESNWGRHGASRFWVRMHRLNGGLHHSTVPWLFRQMSLSGGTILGLDRVSPSQRYGSWKGDTSNG